MVKKKIKKSSPSKAKPIPKVQKIIHRPKDFFVVGIGASAGGLEAFKDFLAFLPNDTGMAFVFIQHLSPRHKSLLANILSRMTEIPVVQVKNGMPLKKNQIFVMPPNVTMVLENGKFKLQKRSNQKIHLPINTFFKSLAEDQGERAISIVLSGTGSDGAEGSRLIKAQGGITIAQEPETARYDSMPSSAIVIDEIDFVLSPKNIALELGNLSKLSFSIHTDESHSPLHEGMSDFKKILLLLKQNMGTDFTQYKPTTIKRRITRRMVLHKLQHLKDYFRLLQNSAEERRSLCEDVLINVTTFFREPESYLYLKDIVLKNILKAKSNGDSIRIWVAGCSTGEEAYSIAITLMEALEETGKSIDVQIFATDLSEKCIERARMGKYLESISEHVSEQRLKKYFVKTDSGYRVSKTIRDYCIFARHDLSRDPAYSKLDLISCKNLLIYLGQDLQSKVIQNFHYSLKLDGYLFLGESESIGKEISLFQVVDSKFKVYLKKSINTRPRHNFDRSDFTRIELRVPDEKKENSIPNSFELQVEADRAILARYSPPSVIINQNMEVIQFRGNTSSYLVHKQGEATLNILKMAREGLTSELKKTIMQAREKDLSIRAERIKFNGNGVTNIEVIPLVFLPGSRCFLVIFEGMNASSGVNATSESNSKKKRTTSTSEDDLTTQLKNELNSSRENLQAVIQDFEKANQELQSANEEVLSANEELQSTNEELETSKEELQSTNEELSTVNDELHGRNLELFSLNNDLNNVLNSVHIPIVIIGNDLSIRRFTKSASKIFNFIATDVGRPLSHITSNVINMPDLSSMIKNVLEHAVIEEKNVHKADGSWYRLRIRPYKTQDNKIEGAVVTLQEIEMTKLVELTKTITDIVKLPMLVLDKDLKVIHANSCFYSRFNFKSTQIETKSLGALPKPINSTRIKTIVSELMKSKKTRAEVLLTLDFPKKGKCKLIVSATKTSKDKLIPPRILVTFENPEKNA